ncbi:CRISPR-associated RAMP protein Csx7 [Sulfolobus tengchongensis]|uniref:CRISPR-associated RAMP protein Csx7 n=1 Tax=Sulfolobus tengchongensis TaxID=207809 RepID=A0AAX4L4D9_9CREN
MVDYTFIRRDLIKRQTSIEGTIVLTAPLRIGSGKSSFDPASIARDPILRNANGEPVIPGSSWKGIFRSTGERILSSNKNIEVCSGVGRDHCLNKRRLYDRFQQSIVNDVNEAIEIFWKYTCLNCKLFGTMSVVGIVRFLDSIPITYSIGIRTMVAISRTEGAAASKALVQVEYVEPGSKFTFRLIGNNLPNYAIGYLLTIMNSIHSGMTQVGGHKSRGFGFVKFERLKFTDIGVKKVGDEDIEVKDMNGTEGDGDKFFEAMKPFMEAFNNAKIPYPEK